MISVEYHFERAEAFGFRFQTVLPQSLVYIFHVDNGIVDQRTDGYGHTSQTHRVDSQPHVVKREDGDE